MKLTHIQVFKKECMKLEKNIFVYKQIPFFLLMFCMFKYSYNKIYTNEYLNRDIVVYLK